MNSMCTCVRKAEQGLVVPGLEGQTVQGREERFEMLFFVTQCTVQFLVLFQYGALGFFLFPMYLFIIYYPCLSAWNGSRLHLLLTLHCAFFA